MYLRYMYVFSIYIGPNIYYIYTHTRRIVAGFLLMMGNAEAFSARISNKPIRT